MIKQLRKQLIFIMMGCFTVIIVALIALIAIAPEREKKAQIRTALENYALQNKPFEPTDGPLDMPTDVPSDMPSGAPSNAPSNTPEESSDSPNNTQEPQPPEVSNEVSSLSPQNTGTFRDFGGNAINIEINNDGTMSSWSTNRENYYDEDTIQAIVSLIQKSNEEFDNVKGYYFLCHKTPAGYSYTVLDATAAVLDSKRVFTWAVVGGLVAWAVLFALSLKLSSMMIRPIQEAFERQNRFIADAGHELKTPIAVIQANADVLESEQGKNKWLSYIKTETHRMDGLVKDLMFLTSMNGMENENGSVDFSSVVKGSSLPFEALAFEKGMSLNIEVQDNIFVHGSSFQLEKLVSILLSNAVKYGEKNGSIDIELYEKHKNACLKVRNTGIGIQPADKEKIFERFYRVDKARSRADGSYGLGLAMAKNIAEIHHGKLSVESEYGKWIEFSFEMRGL